MSIRIPFLQSLDAVKLNIQGDNLIAIQQHGRKVTQAATDFQDTLPDLSHDETALPHEVRARLCHAFLIGKYV
jgi:antitoxin component of MazEF toxin-antitoxin module